VAKLELKAEAIRLRQEKRLSLEAIAKRLGVAKSSCSLWLRNYPLTRQEIEEREEQGCRQGGRHKKDWGAPSKYYRPISDNNQKGKVAEAAVAFRLALNGLEFYRGDNTKADFIIDTGGHSKKLQVKWARLSPKTGLPFARIVCSNGRKHRKYRPEELDFIVIYNFYTDIAYVYSLAEIGNREYVTITEDAAERWDKLFS
jgi:transposase-like protein